MQMLRIPVALAAALTAATTLLLPAASQADGWADKIDFSGYLQSDLRYVLDDWRGATGEGRGFQMNRNDLSMRLKATPDPRVQAVIETKLRFYGFNKTAQLQDLSLRSTVDPFDVRLEEAYVAVQGVFGPMFDLKVGRMIQSWGTADMFNPTDNLNARDFSDPMEYTAKVPNEMIELDMYPTDWLTLTAVWVPVFKPAMLPDSAPFAFAVDYDRNGCFVAAPTPPLQRDQMGKLVGMFNALDPCALKFVNPQVRTLNPSLSLRNSQAAARAKFRIGDVDLSLSYYYGRFSFPVAYTAVADVVGPGSASKGLAFATDEVEIDPKKTNVKYVAEVTYPRMQVIGFDMAYSLSWLWDIGFVGEVALVLPEEVTFGMTGFMNGARLDMLTMSTVNVPSTPFVKATVGLDYTFSNGLYLNGMYVRGFFDEFNDMFGIHNYFVAAAEMKFLDAELVIRLAGALNCDDTSANVYPQITWVVAPAVELAAGVMWFFGDTKPSDPLSYASKSKFGQKAVGRDFAFMKAKVTW